MTEVVLVVLLLAVAGALLLAWLTRAPPDDGRCLRCGALRGQSCSECYSRRMRR